MNQIYTCNYNTIYTRNKFYSVFKKEILSHKLNKVQVGEGPFACALFVSWETCTRHDENEICAKLRSGLISNSLNSRRNNPVSEILSESIVSYGSRSSKRKKVSLSLAGKEEIRFVSRFSAFVPCHSPSHYPCTIRPLTARCSVLIWLASGKLLYQLRLCFFHFFFYRISFTLPCGKVCRVTWRRHSCVLQQHKEPEQERQQPAAVSIARIETGWGLVLLLVDNKPL